MPFARSPSAFLRSNMDKLRRSIRQSFRRRSHKDHSEDTAKMRDEIAVRQGTCSFSVKYLGCVEVKEQRGIEVTDMALQAIRVRNQKPLKGILFVSGDGLRVVDATSKNLIVDQTIERVSFCAPDRHDERQFAYICRDGTTRRWMCHGFRTIKDTGERLSNAVGCAFAICLEMKTKRDREAQVQSRSIFPNNNNNTTNNNVSSNPATPVNATGQSSSRITKTISAQFNGDSNSVISQNVSSFSRCSFKRASLAERKQDPQNVIAVEKLPVRPTTCPDAVARPIPNRALFDRHGSLRMPESSTAAFSSSNNVTTHSTRQSFQHVSTLKAPTVNTTSGQIESKGRCTQSSLQNWNASGIFTGVSAIWEGDEEESNLATELNQNFSSPVGDKYSQKNFSLQFVKTPSFDCAPSTASNSLSMPFAEPNVISDLNSNDEISQESTRHETVPENFMQATQGWSQGALSVLTSGDGQAMASGKSPGEEWLQTAARQAKLMQLQNQTQHVENYIDSKNAGNKQPRSVVSNDDFFERDSSLVEV